MQPTERDIHATVADGKVYSSLAVIRTKHEFGLRMGNLTIPMSMEQAKAVRATLGDMIQDAENDAL